MTDYGLALINTSSNPTLASSTAGNSRWLAPEIIYPPDLIDFAVESKPADVFAFGMLGAEVFTGQLPFEGHSNLGAAHLISKGGRPELPQNAEVTVQVRELLQRCWDQDPVERPVIDEVVETLEGILKNKYVRITSITISMASSFLTQPIYPVDLNPWYHQRGPKNN